MPRKASPKPDASPPTDQLELLKWTGVHQRAKLFDPENMTALAALWIKEPSAVRAMEDYWRTSKVPNVREIMAEIKKYASEMLRAETLETLEPTSIWVTYTDGALPVIDAIADATKRLLSVFYDDGRLVRIVDSRPVPVTAHWLGVTLESHGVAFVSDWKSNPGRSFPPIELLQTFLDVADRYSFPPVP